MSTKLINGFQLCLMSIFQYSLLLTCIEASSTVTTSATAIPAAVPATVATATPTVATSIAPQPNIVSQSLNQNLSPDEKLQQLHDQIDEANNNINEQAHQQLVASITDKHKKCADLEIDVKRLKKKYSLRIKELHQLKATIAKNEEKLKALIGE